MNKLSLGVALLLCFQVLLFDGLGNIGFLTEVSSRLVLVTLTGYLFFFVYLAEISIRDIFRQAIASMFLVLLTAGVFWYWTHNINDLYIHVQIPLILSAMVLLGKFSEINDDGKIWIWQVSFAKSVIEAVLSALVFTAAVFMIASLVEFVFEIEIPKSTFESFLKIGATLVPCAVFLIRMRCQREVFDNFLRGLVRFLIVPLWLIYIALLNIYAFKILIHWSLPKGMVALPVSVGLAIYIAVWWGLLHLRKDAHSWPSERVVGLVKWAQLPLLGLMAIAMWRRVSDYSITQPRYFLILLWVLFAAVIVLDLTKRLKGKAFACVFISACLLSLIAV